MYRLQLTTTLVLVMFFPPSLSEASSEKQSLSYSISLNKETYLPLEPIIIISKLKNIGTKTIEVNEPSGTAFTVTYDLYKIDQNRRQQTGAKITGEGPLAWLSQIFALKPNEVCESSCELQWQIPSYPPGLSAGQYIIKASYHLDYRRGARFGMKEYDNNVMSSETSFRIVARDTNQDIEYSDFIKGFYYDGGIGLRIPPAEDIQGRSAYYKAKTSTLEAFISKYPNSPYMQLVIDELSIDLSYLKEHKKIANNYLQELKKGTISSGRRERHSCGAADELLRVGDVKGAIDVLSEDDKHQRLIKLKEDLEKGNIPQTFRDAVEEWKKEKDSQTGK